MKKYVIITIAICAALILGLLVRKKYMDKHLLAISAEESSRGAIHMFCEAVERFKHDMNRYPTTEEGLDVLFRPPAKDLDKIKWKGPYFDAPTKPNDYFGHPYVYQFPAVRSHNAFDLFSLGGDGVVSNDDIGV